MPISILDAALALAMTTEPAEPQYLPTVVEVDVGMLVEQAPNPNKNEEFERLERITAERTGTQVHKSVQAALVEHGVPMDGGKPAITVLVRLEWKVYIDSYYVAHLVARRPDGTEDALVVECRMCSEPKLAATVAERVPEILPALEVTEEAAAPQTAPGGDAPATDAAEPSEPDPGGGEGKAGEVRKIGPVGWAGIAALVVGAGTTVGGIIVLTEEPAVDLRPLADAQDRTSSRRPLGAGLTAVGASLLGVGVVMLAVDQTVLRKRRARRQAGTLIPVALPAMAGFVLNGRF